MSGGPRPAGTGHCPPQVAMMAGPRRHLLPGSPQTLPEVQPPKASHMPQTLIPEDPVYFLVRPLSDPSAFPNPSLYSWELVVFADHFLQIFLPTASLILVLG